MKKVLVTGSNGLLGQKLTDFYRKAKGVQLIATGVGPDRYPIQDGYEYAELDITNPVEIDRIIAKYKPHTIINAAAMTNVDACETQQEACLKLNVEAVGLLAECCTKNDIHLIHISTDFIFDGTKKLYQETDAANPISFYGMSKWKGEQEVVAKALKWSIVRTIIVFGVAHNLTRSNTVLWAYNVLKDQTPAKIVDDQYRTPTLAEDLAWGCSLIESKEAMGIYNISGKDFMSIYELTEAMSAHFGFSMKNISRVKSDSLNQPAKRPPITGLDISKARKDLGFEPHSFIESLDIFEEQYKQNQ